MGNNGPDVAEAVAQALSVLKQMDGLHIPRDFRRAIYEAFGPFGDPLADRRRTYLSLLAARRSEPVYVEVFHCFQDRAELSELAEGVAANAESVDKVLAAVEGTVAGTMSYRDAFSVSMEGYEVGYYVDNLRIYAEQAQDDTLIRLAVRGQHAYSAAMETINVALLGYHPVSEVDRHKQYLATIAPDLWTNTTYRGQEAYFARETYTPEDPSVPEDAATHGALAVAWTATGWPFDEAALHAYWRCWLESAVSKSQAMHFFDAPID